MTWRVALVGAGGVGRKRAAAIAAHPDTTLVAVCDTDAAAAARLAGEHGAQARGPWPEVVAAGDTDLVVVSTTHDALAAVSTAALQAGKHVLCEKPLGRTAEEVAVAVAAARAAGRVFRAGYNHRFHPAVAGAHRAVADGRLGQLVFLRGRYGHGGRPGYEREWRADPGVSGGGELLDQGAHLVDLVLWLFDAQVDVVSATTLTAFWDTPVEDNAFAFLRTTGGQVASLHVSWTQWRNLFSLEVFGRDGYAVAEGLGGSYGAERLAIGRRRPEGGAPDEQVTAFDGADRSWALEWSAFVDAAGGKRAEGADGEDALRTMRCIRRIYEVAASSAASTPEA